MGIILEGPGLVLPSSGGGSVPSGSAGDAVTLDGAGGLAASSVSALLAAQRRLAADANTRLLWECGGASGVLANTGSLGAAGNLTAGGSCVRNALSARSTIGRGIKGNGSASGGATGATGISITGTAFTATVTFVVNTWPGGSVPILARNAGPTWSPPYLGFRISLNSGGVIQAEIELAGGAHPSPYANGYSAGMHQAVATYDGANFRLYVDGALAASTAATAAIAMGSGGDWGIAAQGDGGGLDGYVLRAQVDAVAWSADRVAEEWLRTLGDY